MSLFDKCRNFSRVTPIMEAGVWPYFHATAASHDGTEVTIDGRRLVMIGSNNYLGLTHHPKVREAAHQAIRDYGTGCSGSRFLNGTIALHHELEERLAAFLGHEACLVFSTGFQTNLGVLSVIAGKRDRIFCDKENHASIYDGVRLSYARTDRYRHNDMEALERLLAAAPDGENRLVVTDGVFSMLGDLVDLPALTALAQRYDAKVMVDDAHGVGVVGPAARGTCAHFGLEADLLTGTFSKSFGSLGGFAAGPREVIDFVKYTARAMMFSAAMTPGNAGATLAALEVMETEPEHQERLIENVRYMRAGFLELGFDVADHPSAILALPIGDESATFRTWKRLFNEGVFTNAVVPPAVPPGESLLRTSYIATHTRDQLDRCLDVFSRVARELSLVP